MRLDWLNAYSVERELAEILAKQAQHGWKFDTAEANSLVQWLRNEESRLSESILPNLPPTISKGQPLNKIFKVNGDYQNFVYNWISGLDPESSYFGYPRDSLLANRVIAGPFTRIDIHPPSLTSQDQIKKALFQLGWEPDEYNYKKDGKQLLRDDNNELIPTSAKITESSLDKISDESEWGKDLIKLLKVQARLKFFGSKEEGKGLLSHVREDDSIPSEVIQCATNTSRGQHRKIANVPRPGSFLGEESRKLFTCRNGTLLVGTDYSALESRIMANLIYLYTKHKTGKGDTRYAELIESVDDIHTYLWDGLRDMVSERSLCKNINFALPYGAGASKLGSLCDLKPKGMSNTKAGEIVFDVLKEKYPGLIETRDAAAEQAKRGWIPGLDGRKVFVRSAHSAFNAKAQSHGSQLVKYGMILCNRYLKENKIPGVQVGWFHDEFTIETPEQYAEEVQHYALKAVEDSGKHYNLICNMTGTSKIGRNWYEIH